MSKIETVCIDSDVMSHIFSANPNRLRDFLINKAKRSPTLDFPLKFFSLAMENDILCQISNLGFWETYSVLKRNKIRGKRLERAANQILECFNVEKKMNFLNAGLACILGAIVGCDIKNCYHYIFALYNGIPFLVSSDKKFRRAIEEFNQQIKSNDETTKGYVKEMCATYEKFPLLDDNFKESITKGIGTICDPNKTLEIRRPDEMVELLSK